MLSQYTKSYKSWTLVGFFVSWVWFLLAFISALLYFNTNIGYWFTYWTTLSNLVGLIYFTIKTIGLFTDGKIIKKIGKNHNIDFFATNVLALTFIVAIFMLGTLNSLGAFGIISFGAIPTHIYPTLYTGTPKIISLLNATLPHLVTPIIIIIYWFKFTPQKTSSYIKGMIYTFIFLIIFSMTTLGVGMSSLNWWPYTILDPFYFGAYVVVWDLSLFLLAIINAWILNLKHWKVSYQTKEEFVANDSKNVSKPWIDKRLKIINTTINTINETKKVIVKTAKTTSTSINTTIRATTDVVNSTLKGTTDAINSTLKGTTDAINSTLKGTTDAINSTLKGTTDAINSTLKGTTDAINSMNKKTFKTNKTKKK